VRQDLLHCVVVAAHANAVAGGDAVALPRHPAFRSLTRLRFVGADGGELSWAAFSALAPRYALAPGVEPTGVLAGAERWNHEPGPCLRCTAGPAPPPAERGAAPCAAALGDAARRALEAAPERAVWRVDVQRALAILDSGGTGEEVSDVAWPHFLVPSTFPFPARRLAAAAASCWIFGGDLASDLAAAELPPRAETAGLRAAVMDALACAVAANVTSA
jgi:hypothetical protein